MSLGHMEGYQEKFERVRAYFEPQFPEAVKIGNEMMKTILDKTNG